MTTWFVFLVFAISDPLCYLIFLLHVYTGFLQMSVYDCIWSLFESLHGSECRTLLLLSEQEVKLHLIIFLSETIDRYQQYLTAFTKVCLHTDKRTIQKRLGNCCKDKSRYFEFIQIFCSLFKFLEISLVVYPAFCLSVGIITEGESDSGLLQVNSFHWWSRYDSGGEQFSVIQS